MNTQIRIGGIPFTITTVEGKFDVCHNESGQKMWGQISYNDHSIRIAQSNPERELRTTLHEILHGIMLSESFVQS